MSKYRFVNDLSSGKIFNPMYAKKGTQNALQDIKDFSGFGQKGPSPESYLDKIPGILQQNYGPYMQQGQAAYPELANTYASMGEHPSDYINNIMSKFQSSPEYQSMFNQMLGTAGNAGAAGGNMGSSGAIADQAHLADMLSGNEMQNWLKNITDIQGAGLQGQQHFYDTGFNAAQNYSGDLANLMETQASLSSNRARDQNRSHQDLMKSIFDTIGAGSGYLSNWGGYNSPKSNSIIQTGQPYANRYPYA
jgi:hypothetical protein